MAEISINGRMTIGSFKKQFKEHFGATLRVYHRNTFAEDRATIASIRKGGTDKAGELMIMSNMRVKSFEQKMAEIFGIRVQIATPNDKRLVADDKTLKRAGE
jgi:hypothetical protein